jgi:hypothetical protein
MDANKLPNIDPYNFSEYGDEFDRDSNRFAPNS